MIRHQTGIFRAPFGQLLAFPVHDVRDPTGAGDSFAGGLMGYLARAGDPRAAPSASGTNFGSSANFKAALATGTVLASFTVEDFGVRRLLRATAEEIEARFREYCSLLRVDS